MFQKWFRCLSVFIAPVFVVSLCICNPVASQEKTKGKESDKKGKQDNEPKESAANVTYWAPRTLQMKFGVRFHANDNQCTKVHATVPIPMQWPEQKVDVVASNISPLAKYELRPLQGGALQLVIDAASVPPNSTFDAVLTVDMVKSFIKAPEDPSSLKIPKKIPKELNWYVGDSPYIDSKDSGIKKVIREIRATEPANDWEYVEKLYDWVRENIEYRNGKLRSTKEALKEKWGDCEEMTGIFVALCRASGIPARVVWIPEHCYPEFYLEESPGEGYWFPCQVAGERQFGEMNDYRPILQKGDRFKVPEKKNTQRYVAEYFTCKHRPLGPKEPEVQQIRDLGVLQQEIEALRVAPERQNMKLSEADEKESTEKERTEKERTENEAAEGKNENPKNDNP